MPTNTLQSTVSVGSVHFASCDNKNSNKVSITLCFDSLNCSEGNSLKSVKRGFQTATSEIPTVCHGRNSDQNYILGEFSEP